MLHSLNLDTKQNGQKVLKFGEDGIFFSEILASNNDCLEYPQNSIV